MRGSDRFRGFVRNVRDTVELILLPGLAAILPWRVCFKFFRWSARHAWLYRQETEAALAAASAEGMVGDATAWARAYRLTRIVDHADLYLSHFRGSGWMRDHVKVKCGNWPAGGPPFLAITFHWACGMWGLRHMRVSGRSTSGLSKDIPENVFAGRPILAFYARFRTRETESAGGTEVTYANARSLNQILRVLKSGRNVLALLDVPPEERQQYLECTFLGHRAAFPRGLMFLAVAKKIPVVIYDVSLDRVTGDRVISIDPVGCVEDEQKLISLVVSRLEVLIRGDPPSWHHWPGLSAFLLPDRSE